MKEKKLVGIDYLFGTFAEEHGLKQEEVREAIQKDRRFPVPAFMDKIDVKAYWDPDELEAWAAARKEQV